MASVKAIQKEHFKRRLRDIEKSAEAMKDLTVEEMLTRGSFLIAFARNAQENFELVEE